MHMDLKASNVFLTKTYSIAKIGEVDMAQVMGSSALQPPHAATFAYSAPELILNGRCTEKVRLAYYIILLAKQSFQVTRLRNQRQCLKSLIWYSAGR